MLGTVVVPRVKVNEAVLMDRLVVSEGGTGEGAVGGGAGAVVGAVVGAGGGTSGLRVSMTV